MLSIFLVSFVIAIAGAMSPGPMLATVIYESAHHGTKTGPLIVVGHAILEILMVAVIVLGLAQLINNPLTLKLISAGGAVILIYFGVTMIVAIPGMSLRLTGNNKRSGNLILTGFGVSLSNPYWTIWWLTIGMGLILGAQKAGLIAIAVFFLGHILADFVWYTTVSLTISKGKNWLSDQIYRSILFICAVSLLFFGGYFGLSAFRL